MRSQNMFWEWGLRGICVTEKWELSQQWKVVTSKQCNAMRGLKLKHPVLQVNINSWTSWNSILIENHAGRCTCLLYKKQKQ